MALVMDEATKSLITRLSRLGVRCALGRSDSPFAEVATLIAELRREPPPSRAGRENENALARRDAVDGLSAAAVATTAGSAASPWLLSLVERLPSRVLPVAHVRYEGGRPDDLRDAPADRKRWATAESD